MAKLESNPSTLERLESAVKCLTDNNTPLESMKTEIESELTELIDDIEAQKSELVRKLKDHIQRVSSILAQRKILKSQCESLIHFIEEKPETRSSYDDVASIVLEQVQELIDSDPLRSARASPMPGKITNSGSVPNEKEVPGSPSPVEVSPRTYTIQMVTSQVILKGPWGVAVNKSDEVIVAEMKGCSIQIFGVSGKSHSFSTDAKGAVYGLTVDGDNNILAAMFAAKQVVKYSPHGNLIETRVKPRQFDGPISVHVNRITKSVYVVDNLAHCVHILNPDLTFLNKFGSQGSEDGQFKYPRDIAIDSASYVYVVDEVNHRVQVFTPEGIYQRKFGTKGSGNGELHLPVSICIDSEDRVYVGEDINARISVFTSKGDFVRSFGSKGTGPGQFDRPFGLAVRSGLLYVCDYGNDRVQVIPVNK